MDLSRFLGEDQCDAPMGDIVKCVCLSSAGHSSDETQLTWAQCATISALAEALVSPLTPHCLNRQTLVWFGCSGLPFCFVCPLQQTTLTSTHTIFPHAHHTPLTSHLYVVQYNLLNKILFTFQSWCCLLFCRGCLSQVVTNGGSSI